MKTITLNFINSSFKICRFRPAVYLPIIVLALIFSSCSRTSLQDFYYPDNVVLNYMETGRHTISEQVIFDRSAKLLTVRHENDTSLFGVTVTDSEIRLANLLSLADSAILSKVDFPVLKLPSKREPLSWEYVNTKGDKQCILSAKRVIISLNINGKHDYDAIELSEQWSDIAEAEERVSANFIQYWVKDIGLVLCISKECSREEPGTDICLYLKDMMDNLEYTVKNY